MSEQKRLKPRFFQRDNRYNLRGNSTDWDENFERIFGKKEPTYNRKAQVKSIKSDKS